MRRAVLAVAVLTLVAGACTGDDDEARTAPTAPTTATTAAPTATTPAPTFAPAAHDPACTLAPPRPGGEVTFVAEGGRLVGVDPAGGAARCLADGLATPYPGVRWGPTGDRLLVGSGRTVLTSGETGTAFSGRDRADWSRPTGKSVLAVTAAGRLLKQPAGGGEPVDVSFVDRHESALYHPAGRAIVSVGEGPAGYSLYLADNQGQGRIALARNETARHLGPMAWTASGALLFAADHGDHWDLHRLELGGALTTVASTEAGGEEVADLVASPFPGGGVAWRQGDCAMGPPATRISRGGQFLDVPPAVATATPVGWLPDGTLVLVARGEGCAVPHAEADVYAFRDGRATRIATGAWEVAVRVPVPAAPELPASIPDDAPA